MQLKIAISELERLLKNAKKRSKQATHINIHSSGQCFLSMEHNSGGVFCHTLLWKVIQDQMDREDKPMVIDHVPSISQKRTLANLQLVKETGDKYKLDIITELGQTSTIIRKYANIGPVTARTKKQARQKARNIRNEFLQEMDNDRFYKHDTYIGDRKEPGYYAVYWTPKEGANPEHIMSINITTLD